MSSCPTCTPSAPQASSQVRPVVQPEQRAVLVAQPPEDGGRAHELGVARRLVAELDHVHPAGERRREQLLEARPHIGNEVQPRPLEPLAAGIHCAYGLKVRVAELVAHRLSTPAAACRRWRSRPGVEAVVRRGLLPVVDVQPLDPAPVALRELEHPLRGELARLSVFGNSVSPFGSTNFTMPPVSVSQTSPFTAFSSRFVPPRRWPLRLFVSR